MNPKQKHDWLRRWTIGDAIDCSGLTESDRLPEVHYRDEQLAPNSMASVPEVGFPRESDKSVSSLAREGMLWAASNLGHMRCPPRLVASIVGCLLLATGAVADARAETGASPTWSNSALRAWHDDALRRLVLPEHSGSLGPAVLYAAGDMDADGSEDAIEDWIGGHLTGLKTSNGQVLWLRDFKDTGGYGGLALPAGNLDGTPGDDVIVAQVGHTGSAIGNNGTLTYTGMRGRDGATLWVRVYSGLERLDAGDPIGLTGDLNGDGASDLIHRSVSSLLASGTLTNIDVISGRDGSLIANVTRFNVNGQTTAGSVPDLSGDGRRDLVVISGEKALEGRYMGLVEAFVPGETTPMWRAPFESLGDPIITGTDLTVSPGSEILITSDGYNAGGVMRSAFGVLSGTAGDTLWSKEIDGAATTTITEDGTGDGLRDLIVVSHQYTGWPYPSTTGLIAGADGSWRWTHPAQGQVFVDVVSDLTNDGVADLVSTATFYDYETFVPEPGELISGADGSVVWRETESVEGSLLGLDGDLNGDGVEDLALLELNGPQPGIMALNGRNGNRLWGPQVPDGQLFSLQAVQTSAGPLVLESSYRWGYSGPPPKAFTGARSGTNGALLWQRNPCCGY